MAAEYRYIIAETISGEGVEELSDASDVSFSWTLRRPGAFSAKFPKHYSFRGPDGTVAKSLGYDTIFPVLHSIFVERNGVIIWGGIIWSVDSKGSSNSVTVQAEGFSSYFRARSQLWSTDSLVFVTADLFNIVDETLSTFFSQSRGSIGLEWDFAPEQTGVPLTKTFHWYEFRTIEAILNELSSSVDQGFDWHEEYYRKGKTAYGKKIIFTAKRRGVVLSEALEYSSTGDLGTNTSDYTTTIDGKQMMNDMIGVGYGTGASVQKARATADYLTSGSPQVNPPGGDWSGPGQATVGGSALVPASKMPVVNGIYRAKRYDYSPLNESTKVQLKLRETPPAVNSMTLLPDASLELGTYLPGDYVRCVVDDDYVQFNELHRISSISTQIDAGGQEVTTVHTGRPFADA